jgi:hypothetical protein
MRLSEAAGKLLSLFDPEGVLDTGRKRTEIRDVFDMLNTDFNEDAFIPDRGRG